MVVVWLENKNSIFYFLKIYTLIITTKETSMNNLPLLIVKSVVFAVPLAFSITANAQPAFNISTTASNYSDIGSEFISYTCPNDYKLDAPNKTCSQLQVSNYSQNCPIGYNHIPSSKNCSKTQLISVTFSCPSGYNLKSKKCSKLITEKRYKIGKFYSYYGESLSNASFVFAGTYHGDRRYGTYWEGIKKFNYPTDTNWTNHSDGWQYKRGAYKTGGGGNGGGYSRFEVIRKKTITNAASQSCSSGYRLSGNQCKKTMITAATKYCKTGTLNNNRCELVNIVAATKHSPIEDLVKSLYYNQGKQSDAAFRYLDLMYTLDNNSQGVSDLLSNKQFSSLWGGNERNRAINAINQLSRRILQRGDLVYLKQLLMDVYYDRAVAESILANQSIDQARIDWIEKKGSSSIHSNIADRQVAINIIQAAIDDYWTLIDNYADTFKTFVPSRGLSSPNYIDGNGNSRPVMSSGLLFQGHKDTAMLYTLMNMLAEQKLAVAKLTIQSGENDPHAISSLQVDLNALSNELTAKDNTLKALFGTHELHTVATKSGLAEAMVKFETNLNALSAANSWLSGETNLLGLPQDSVLLVQGYGIGSNTIFDSFDALKEMIAEPSAGALAQAKNARSSALTQYSEYNHNRDLFRNSYQITSRSLNDQLFNLLGCTLESSNSNDCIVANSKRAGSQVAQQLLLITSAKQGIERAQQQHQNLLDAMTIEEDRLAEEKGISEALEKIVIQFGEQQLQLQKFINESNSSSIFNSKDIQSQLDTINDFVNDNGLVILDEVLAASRDFESKIKGMKPEDAKNYAAALAALERASLMSKERGLLDSNSRARIRNLMLELKTADLDIARSMTSLAQETERLIGMLNQAKRIKAQLKAHDTEQLDRYYADPLHFTRLRSDATKAEDAFENLQEWLFYAVGALEYKWQEPFVERSNGFNKSSLFNLYTIEELDSYYNSLVKFNNARNLRSTQQAIDTFSLKKHVFGYFDEIQGKTQWYPAPSGSGEMLTADEAFKSKLNTMTRRFGADTWLTVEFSTVKEIPRSNFFQGPVVASNNDISCLADGGTYLDKIESISINLPTSYTISGEESTPAYLTYGGNNYLRSKVPGKLTDDGLGVNDEIIAYSTRFWDMTNGQLTFTNSFRQQMSANITQTDETSLEMLNPTFSFKERSVAASGWRLSVKLSDRSGDIIDIDALNDIELLFKHRFKSRNFATCGGNNGGPLLLLK